MVTNLHNATTLTMVGLNWTHHEHWQMGLGWRQVGGSAHGVADRMVELSTGAPLHESGVRITAAYMPGGQDDPHHTSIGFEARHSSISVDDLAELNLGQRQDTQALLVARRSF